MIRMGIPSIHLQKNLGPQGVLLYLHLATLRSTALLKLRPDDERPYRLPNTWRIIPLGAMIPGGLVMHSMNSLLRGVTRYAPTRSPPRNIRP